MKSKSILLRVLVLGVCAYMIAKSSGLWNMYAKSQKDLEELNREKASVQNDIDELKILLEEGSEAKIIEKAARERLGFAYPDEQVFIDISGN